MLLGYVRYIVGVGLRYLAVGTQVVTGRAERSQMLDAKGHERVYQRLADLRGRYDFDIKTTAGQPFYRVLAQRSGNDPSADLQRFGLRSALSVNDGKGIVFIDHVGEVFPSGFLDRSCGNLADRPLAEIYREHPLLRRLRDPDALGGKCGRCPYRELCGGSRSRAYALTGDPLAEDPTCVYRPRTRTREAVPA